MSAELGVTLFKKPSKNVLMFFVSLAIGGIGVFYSKQYIESEIALFKDTLDVKEEMTEVVVPVRNIGRGELISQEDLRIREIPTQYIDSNSITDSTFEAALGQKVGFNLDVGKPLLWAHLEGGGASTFSANVPTGLRAMTIRVDEITSFSGFLQPKDRIDLLLTYGDKSRKKIIPLIQNLNVLATGVQTQIDKQNTTQHAFSTITIQVSPQQAQKISLSQQVGKITAMLRHPDDESLLSEEPMDMAIVLNQPLPAQKAKYRTRPLPKPKVKTAQIEYIIGGT